MIARAVGALRADGGKLHVVDIAAGGGRYVLEALCLHAPGASVVLRDCDPLSIETGRAVAGQLGTEGVRCEPGDAFDRAGLPRLSPRPTIAIAAGLYELFPENAPVRESLAGLAAAVPPDGYLVYTNQPWHPQLELIARTLFSHRGDRPWVMRRRSQAEIDGLVAAAGFEKVAMAIDEHAITTVSLARRSGAEAVAAPRAQAAE